MDRNNSYEKVIQIDTFERKKQFSEYALKEIRNEHFVESHFKDNQLFLILLDFFKEAGDLILMENALLVSRWARFCRTSVDIQKYSPLFRKRQQQLKLFYAENMQRYERLYGIDLKMRNHKLQQEVPKTLPGTD